MTERMGNRVIQIIIPVLALADGVLHLSLDFVLFRGNLLGGGPGPRPPSGAAPGRTTPPPGARPLSLPLPLNQLFLLNFVGEVVLVLLFLFVRRRLGERRWLLDLVMIVYAAATFVAWWLFGRPNPMGLGYLSKGIEIVLIIALVADIWSVLRPRVVLSPAS